MIDKGRTTTDRAEIAGLRADHADAHRKAVAALERHRILLAALVAAEATIRRGRQRGGAT